MRTVFKYVLPVDELITVKMPKGAQILCAKSQYGQDVTLWALVDHLAEEEKRTFRVAGTGQPLDSIDLGGRVLKHIDTAMLMEGQLVLHVFEVVPE